MESVRQSGTENGLPAFSVLLSVFVCLFFEEVREGRMLCRRCLHSITGKQKLASTAKHKTTVHRDKRTCENNLAKYRNK